MRHYSSSAASGQETMNWWHWKSYTVTSKFWTDTSGMYVKSVLLPIHSEVHKYSLLGLRTWPVSCPWRLSDPYVDWFVKTGSLTSRKHTQCVFPVIVLFCFLWHALLDTGWTHHSRGVAGVIKEICSASGAPQLPLLPRCLLNQSHHPPWRLHNQTV